MPGLVFRFKRRAILRSFIERPRIYGSEHFHQLLEQRARENLVRAVGAGLLSR
ncbi:hypothetical protein [Paucibacter sp. M5-1]|uniref:hypothetical protein n=1 Tax=Paucibacter sp. M5-1 TaxID=3015998 RepID=UPI002FCE0FF6